VSALPTPIDRKAFEAPRRDFEALEKHLRAMVASTAPPTLTQANQAKDFDDRAKGFLDKKNPNSPEAKIGPHRERAHQAWKALVGWLNDEERSALTVRKLCSVIASRYERERQAKVPQQKRDDEARQLAEQKHNQTANVDHLLTIAATTNDPAALDAAIEAEDAQLAPVVSSVDSNAGKVPGSSVTLRKTGGIVDIRVFLAWLSGYASMVDLVEVKADPAEIGPALKINQSALDDKLNRGIEIPGVEVMERAITRNVSKG